MKRLAITVLGVVLASSAAWAERPEGAQGQHRAQHMARMQQHLGLSDEQVSQMREIRENGGSREEMRAVLTDEQRSTMDEHRKNRKAKGQGEGGPAQGD